MIPKKSSGNIVLTFSLSLFKLFAFIGSIKSGECSPEELQYLCDTSNFSKDLNSEKTFSGA